MSERDKWRYEFTILRDRARSREPSESYSVFVPHHQET